MKPLLVVDVAALSPALALRSDRTPNLSDLIARGSFGALEPVFPALTIPVQASLTTGVEPSGHGMVANGIFERESREVHFWHQPESLLRAPRFWTRLRGEEKGLKVAMLFWQNSKYGDADIVVTPHPIHTEKGEVLSHCYSKPAGLYDALEARLGPFPLHHYWGPMAGPPSSEWIARCVETVLAEHRPTITFAYLPLLDYSTQRLGPAAPPVLDDLSKVDSLLGRLHGAAAKAGAAMIVLSEYGMSPVSGACEINRAFRRAGWIAVRTIQGQEFLEIGDCRAFAMVDHQVAHVFVRGGAGREVAQFLRKEFPGTRVLESEEDRRGLHIHHERSGDLVAVAPKDKWFAYPWWLDPARAPSFSRTVDIHRKPGYDPLELFLDPSRKGVAQDPLLVKGSHGAPPDREAEMGIFASSVPVPGWERRTQVRAIEVPAVLEQLLALGAAES